MDDVSLKTIVVLYMFSHELRILRQLHSFKTKSTVRSTGNDQMTFDNGFRSASKRSFNENLPNCNAFSITVPEELGTWDNNSNNVLWLPAKVLIQHFPFCFDSEIPCNSLSKKYCDNQGVRDARLFVRQKVPGISKLNMWLLVDDTGEMAVEDGVLVVQVARGSEHPVLPTIHEKDKWWSFTSSSENDINSGILRSNNYDDNHVRNSSSTKPELSLGFDGRSTIEATKVFQEKLQRTGREMVAEFSKFASWAKESVITAAEAAIVSETIKFKKREVNVGRKIADGGFSEVFFARCNSTGEDLAMKRCLAHSMNGLTDIRMEISLHQTIQSDFVMSLVDYVEVPEDRGITKVMILFPLYSDGSLYDQMDAVGRTRNRKWPFPERALVHFSLGILSAIQALHSAGYSHRDIKPHNVLIARIEAAQTKGPLDIPNDFLNLRPILTDLGSSAPLHRLVKSYSEARMFLDEASVKCSAPYRPPELFYIPTVPFEFDAAQDVWSLGASLYAVTFGRPYSPFEHPTQGLLKLAIMNGTVKFQNDLGYSQGLKQVLAQMMAKEPSDRPSLEVIRAEFLNL